MKFALVPIFSVYWPMWFDLSDAFYCPKIKARPVTEENEGKKRIFGHAICLLSVSLMTTGSSPVYDEGFWRPSSLEITLPMNLTLTTVTFKTFVEQRIIWRNVRKTLLERLKILEYSRGNAKWWVIAMEHEKPIFLCFSFVSRLIICNPHSSIVDREVPELQRL